MNRENVERLKAVLRQKPQQYNQGIYWYIERATDDRGNPCGTACCLAGWSYLLEHGLDIYDRKARRVDSDVFVADARAWLGLSYEQSQVLFMDATEWPEAFAFNSDLEPDDNGWISQAEQAEKACAFLDHMLAGGDVYDDTNRDSFVVMLEEWERVPGERDDV